MVLKQETKQSKSPDNTGKKQRGKGKPFVKNDPRINKEGRPLGSKNFVTDFDEVVEEIAKLNNITFNEARKILLKRAYTEAKDGNFPFYKDIADRYYGKPKEVVELSGKDGNPIPVDLNIVLEKVYGRDKGSD